MERRPETLQQMFNDAQEIQDNILACEQIRSERLGVLGHKSEYEKNTIDWNFEHNSDGVIGLLEILNDNNFSEYYIPLIKREGNCVVSDPPHDKNEVDHFIYSFVDSQEDDFEKEPVEKQVDVPSFFLLDDVADVVDVGLLRGGVNQ
jgi:hypothetical protein